MEGLWQRNIITGEETTLSAEADAVHMVAAYRMHNRTNRHTCRIPSQDAEIWGRVGVSSAKQIGLPHNIRLYLPNQIFATFTHISP